MQVFKGGGHMTLYRCSNGNSGVYSYDIGLDYIEVEYKDENPSIYRYSYKSAGKEKVEKMKELAQNGYGLNSFINKNARGLQEKY